MKYASLPRFIRDDPRQIPLRWDRILTDLFSIGVDLPKLLSLLCPISVFLNSVHPERRVLNCPGDVAFWGMHACFPDAWTVFRMSTFLILFFYGCGLHFQHNRWIDFLSVGRVLSVISFWGSRNRNRFIMRQVSWSWLDLNIKLRDPT